MNNPFEAIENRLKGIEHLLSNLSTAPTVVESSPEFEKPVDIDTAAELLNLKKPTIYSKCSKRELPHFKRGKRLYFFISELDEYIQKGRKKPNTVTRGKAKNYLSKRPEKQYKLGYYLLGILFKKAIQVICDNLDSVSAVFLETPFHQILVMFMNLLNIL